MDYCPEPVKRAVMVQQWRDLAYVHWRYPVEEVQALLPPGLEVDTFDGSAWVGLIPFSMKNIGLPRLPAVPYFGSFPEVNVRTYVRRNGVPGVWFFFAGCESFLASACSADHILSAVLLGERSSSTYGQCSHHASETTLATSG